MLPTPTGQSALADDNPRLEALTQVIAKGLAAANSRAELLAAMRASPFVEHKLVLQDFLQTPSGATFIDGICAAAQIGRDSLDHLLLGMPAFDFYVPGRESRESWRGTANVVVVSTLMNDGKVAFRYDITGQATDQRGGPLSGIVVIAIHPAEPKGLRLDPQPSVPAAVIQDRNDGQMGVTYVDYMSGGDSVVVRLKSARELLVPRARMMTNASVASGVDSVQYLDGGPGSVWLTDLITAFACDHGCIFDGEDIELSPKSWIDGLEQKTQVSGISWRHEYLGNLGFLGWQFRNNRPVGSQSMTIQVWEEDTGGDDLWININVTGSNFPNRLFAGGNVRCDARGDPLLFCGAPNNHIWREINATFAPANQSQTSEPGSTSNPYSASITGPSAGRPNDQCFWSASTNVSGTGTVYEWRAGGEVIGSGTSVYFTPTSSFLLEFIAYNADGGAYASVEVNISNNNSSCPE